MPQRHKRAARALVALALRGYVIRGIANRARPAAEKPAPLARTSLRSRGYSRAITRSTSTASPAAMSG
jgi:hypothetical protein